MWIVYAGRLLVLCVLVLYEYNTFCSCLQIDKVEFAYILGCFYSKQII